MTPAVLDRPAPLFADRAAGAVSGGRVTLEERLNSVLHAARTNGSGECPVCHARMTLTPAGAALAGVAPGAPARRLRRLRHPPQLGRAGSGPATRCRQPLSLRFAYMSCKSWIEWAAADGPLSHRGRGGCAAPRPGPMRHRK